MNVAVSFLDTINHVENNPGDLTSLIAELNRMKKNSEWLAKINDLHARLARALDLTSMIETFSVWLTPFLKHDLIGYNHIDRQRKYMFCSGHGPDRRGVIKVAEETFNDPAKQNDGLSRHQNQFFVHSRSLGSRETSGRLLLVRKHRKIGTDEAEMFDNVLEVLSEPLQRALDYEDLFDQVRQDSLTGLANRRVFDEQIPPLLASAGRHGFPVTLCSMDLDKFKQVNDQLGHAEGDKVLRQVALTFAKMVRSSDILVRMGGDEFLLVLPYTDLQSAHHLGQRLCNAVDQLDIFSKPEEKLGVSIGLAQWHSDLSKEEWIQKADELLYQAKKNGRCRVCME
ncbi:MAG: GGDEF domain-containing protein [Thermodesulfobacteriota bacterium]|nr:GGDEF domain-containing protein [Thermodesulfobacteriota bacterium]